MRATTYNEYLLKMSIAGVPPMSEQDWQARNAAIPQSQPVMVHCNCGHTVPQKLVMAANRGTSCPDCYDRMSE
jgi:hypothetical protein